MIEEMIQGPRRASRSFRVVAMLLFYVLLFMPAAAGEAATDASEIGAALEKLGARDFKSKGQAVSALEKSGNTRAIPVLQALLAGQLYQRRTDRRVVILQDGADPAPISDALSGESLGSAAKRDLEKIIINNQMRLALRGSIARLSFGDADPEVRRAAVLAMLAEASPDTAALVREAMPNEHDKRVLEVMEVVVALADASDSDPGKRLEAVHALGKSLLPEARNRLTALVAARPDGSYVENDPEVRLAARSALQQIESRLKVYGLIETVFFGLSLGFVLVLAATGLAITFGVMRVINMAHGELMMLGAYTTYVVQTLMPNHIDLSLFIAIPAAFVVAALVGIMIERGVVRFLYGRPLETLLATFGISLILQQLVRTVFSPLNRAVSTPSWMSGLFEVNSALALTYNRFYIIVFSILVFAALQIVLKHTRFGLQVRAVAQNRAMAKAMGVRTAWVDAMTFGLGSGIAGLAGVALSQLTNVGPNLGQSYIIDSFMVVVFGGVGNLWGTLVGGLSLGVANKFLEPYAGAVLAKILVLVFIIIFIQRRPRGLFPQRGRAAES